MQETLLDEARTAAPVLDLELEPKTASLPAVAAQRQPAQAAQADPWAMLNNAIQKGYEPAMIEKLMALAERMEQMTERERLRQRELAQARDFAAFTGENIIIPKTKTVNRAGAGSFEQAEFDKVMGMIKPALSRHGFGIRHDQEFGAYRNSAGVEVAGSDGMPIPWVYVTCFLKHRDGHMETLTLNGPPGDLHGNTLVQNQQATASYLKRQSALAITGTPTAEEDNEEKLVRKKADGEKQSEFETLLEAGRAAAVGGTDSLTTWWAGTTPKQKNLLGREYLKLKKDAAAADRPIDHTKEQRK
jgi:hypothetical protein